MWDPPTPPLPHRRSRTDFGQDNVLPDARRSEGSMWDECMARNREPTPPSACSRHREAPSAGHPRSAPPSTTTGASRGSGRRASGAPRCDRCDEAHPTEACPHFRGKRDDHADAWTHYSAAGALPSKPVRECVAPRSLSFDDVRSVRMPGDGSCLFHSLAYGLAQFGCREDGPRIRQRIAAFIEQRPDFEISSSPLKSWVDWDSRTTVGSYASRLASGNTWGGAIEMAACAQIFGVDVAVYEQDSYRERYRRISDFLTDQRPRGAVLVVYLGRAHYNALLPSRPLEAAPATRRGAPSELEEDESWCGMM